MMGFLRAAYVIGRRDFVSSVYSRYFIFFLLGPLVIIGISALIGNVTQKVAQQSTRTVVAVISSQAEYQEINQARDRLGAAIGDRSLPDLVQYEPDYDVSAQTRDLLAAPDKRIVAVLTGGARAPVLTGSVDKDGGLRKEVGLILDEARQHRLLESSQSTVSPTDVRVVTTAESAGALARARSATAGAGQLLLFFLTVLLSGMLLSNMLEEKSNKVIEVLAAAVPVDAIFFGKIVSMLAISLVGVTVWLLAAFGVIVIWTAGGPSLPEPAVGWPLFVIMLFVYFSINYLLLGALFLGIGSQAASVREVQTLSMPITVGQMLIFVLAQVASAAIHSPIGIIAAIFPFSSPLTMVSRAAQSPEFWPHLLALVWQGLWVWIVVRLGAGLFRRNVLKSGSVTARPA